MLSLPVISVRCPSTQTNGLLGREHERGGPMADGNRDIFIKTCKGRQRTSFEVLTEHLPAGSENETEPICALQHILLNCKIKSLLSLNGGKKPFPKQRYSMMVHSPCWQFLCHCNATVLCCGVKGASQFQMWTKNHYGRSQCDI